MPEATFHIFHLYKIFLSSKLSYATAPWKHLFSNTYLYTYPAKGNVRTPKEIDSHTNVNSLPVSCKHEEAAFSFSAIDVLVLSGVGLTFFSVAVSFGYLLGLCCCNRGMFVIAERGLHRAKAFSDPHPTSEGAGAAQGPEGGHSWDR